MGDKFSIINGARSLANERRMSAYLDREFLKLCY